METLVSETIVGNFFMLDLDILELALEASEHADSFRVQGVLDKEFTKPIFLYHHGENKEEVAEFMALFQNMFELKLQYYHDVQLCKELLNSLYKNAIKLLPLTFRGATGNAKTCEPNFFQAALKTEIPRLLAKASQLHNVKMLNLSHFESILAVSEELLDIDKLIEKKDELMKESGYRFSSIYLSDLTKMLQYIEENVKSFRKRYSAILTVMDLQAIKREVEEWKVVGYDNGETGCPHCGRSRLMLCKNQKHRCEKCQWCPEHDAHLADVVSRLAYQELEC